MSNTAGAFDYEDKHVREARNRLWNAGILEWKLSGTQKNLYDFYHSANHKVTVVNASRRLGKSYFLITLALEQCIKYPGSIVIYIQPTRDMIKSNLNPDFERMIEDCPLEIRPVYKTAGNVWLFPNGSRIQLAGTDGQNYEKLRGINPHLSLVDEAGICSDLKKIINRILIPASIKTKGRVIVSSTTPEDPNHEFIKQMELAEIAGSLIRKTILDAVEDDKGRANPQMTEEILADIIKDSGGIDTSEFKTEFLCQIIYNSDDAVLPEFSQAVQDDTILPWMRPPFFDKYESMDIGFTDLTVILYAYWDYDNAVLVIEDETVIKGTEVYSNSVADKIKAKEKELWQNLNSKDHPEIYKRVSDNNPILLTDLSRNHGLYFLATAKHDKDAYLGELRIMISERKIIIHPRCKTLIAHMRGVTWDKSRKSYKRSGDMGHFDAVDALLYLARNIDKSKNPYPNGYRYSQLGDRNNVFVKDLNGEKEINAEYNKIKEMFKRKSSFTRSK